MENKLINMFFVLVFLLSLLPAVFSLTKLSLAKSMVQLKQNTTNTPSSSQATVFVPNSQTSNKNKFFFVYGSCSQQNCKGPFGYCENPSQCNCFHGYANYDDKSKPQSNLYCQYVQKSQLTAFLLELFLPSGIGHLYANRLTSGLIKLSLAILFCVIYGALKYYLHSETKSDIFAPVDNSDNESAETEKYLGILFCFLCCSLFVWQIVDLVMFGINKYNDGNDVPLASW